MFSLYLVCPETLKLNHVGAEPGAPSTFAGFKKRPKEHPPGPKLLVDSLQALRRLPAALDLLSARAWGARGEKSLDLESPWPFKNEVITQNHGAMDPFLRGHGDSRDKPGPNPRPWNGWSPTALMLHEL